MNQTRFGTTPLRRINPTRLMRDLLSCSEENECRLLGFKHQERLIPKRLLYAIETLCLGKERDKVTKFTGDYTEGSSGDFGSHWTYRKWIRNPPLSVLDLDYGALTEYVLHLHYTVKPKEGTFTCSVNRQVQDPLDFSSKKTVNVLLLSARLKGNK